MSNLLLDFDGPVWHVLECGATDRRETRAAKSAQKILSRIVQYCEKFGPISISCGGEWMYQDDEPQVEALELVADILDDLKEYAEPSEEE